jgi:hypothetical protein
MAVIAKFIYEVKPGRLADFMRKLAEAAHPRFNSDVMPQSVRLFRGTVPGPDTGQVVMLIEYATMSEYGARTDFESNNPAWRELFAARADSPERLVSVELLTEFDPTQAL